MKPNLLFLIAIVSSTLFNISESYSAAEDNSTLSRAAGSISAVSYSCQCVAFRLDDVQDYYLNQVQMEIIRTFEKNNASLTIGIIGNYIGEDMALTTFLKEWTEGTKINSNEVIGVANHGWNHEDFTLFDKETQSILIQNSTSKIFGSIGVRPTVFIPPFNSVNNDTIVAAYENDIRYISANATSYPPFVLQYRNESNDVEDASTTDVIIHFPSTVATGDLNSDNTQWYGSLHNDTFRAVKESMHEFGYAVVTMHPQEYSSRNGLDFRNEVDQAQIHELELLIDDIRVEGFEIVTISQINGGNSTSIPEFSSYSIHVILAVSVLIVIWLSTKGYSDVSKYFGRRSGSASF